MTTDTEKNHAKDQAKAQYESICEMVDYLDENSGIERFANKMPKAEIRATLNAVDIREGIEDSELEERLIQAVKDGDIDPEEADADHLTPDQARERIQEDALEVCVRSGWHSPGSDPEPPSEFFILLCTGGPACRIRGELDNHGQPDRAWLEYQDWGTPWTQYFDAEQSVLLQYASQFYFGEG